MNNLTDFPKHIAIIMDGNRRWATQKGFNFTTGHKRGVDTLAKIINSADKFNIQYLTLYSFSKENWNRSEKEVNNLMSLMEIFVDEHLDSINKKNIKINIIGDKSTLSQDHKSLIEDIENKTHYNTGMILNAAFNYSGRDEIKRMILKVFKDIKSKSITESDINEDLISEYLDTKDIPDPDLIIRTSGEKRISNFLLWQCAYSEFVFYDTLWPDFSEILLEDAINQYRSRDRRFGSS